MVKSVFNSYQTGISQNIRFNMHSFVEQTPCWWTKLKFQLMFSDDLSNKKNAESTYYYWKIRDYKDFHQDKKKPKQHSNKEDNIQTYIYALIGQAINTSIKLPAVVQFRQRSETIGSELIRAADNCGLIIIYNHLYYIDRLPCVQLLSDFPVLRVPSICL